MLAGRDGVPAAVARQPGHRVLRLESGEHVAPRRVLAGEKDPDLHDASQPRQVASSGKLVDDRPQRSKGRGSAVDSFSASDGLRLAYRIDDFTDPWKEAPVLLLLHAAMGSMRRYYAWVPPLSRHYRVVRMDLRGHGSSQVPSADRELTLERLVGDVAELLDYLGCPSAHIVGNSAGGYLAQQLAMNQTQRVRSLMLFGSTPGLRNSQAPSWIPQIEAKGLRAFLAETIADRLPRDK